LETKDLHVALEVAYETATALFTREYVDVGDIKNAAGNYGLASLHATLKSKLDMITSKNVEVSRQWCQKVKVDVLASINAKVNATT
jgi:hypothetical protein